MTDITITLGNSPALTAEERKQRALRAAEVLGGAGWLFSEVISGLTRELLDTAPDESEKREELYLRIDATAQLRGHLDRIIQTQQAEEKAYEQRYRNEPPADAE